VEDYPDENVIYDDPNWKDIMIDKVATGMYCLENQPPEIKAAMKDDYDNTMEEYKGYLESDTTEDLERTYSTMADLFRNEDYKIFDIRKEVFKEKAKEGKKNSDKVKIVDNRTPKEKRLAFREKAAKEVLRQRGRFITTRDAMIRMKKEYLTGKTKNDLPIHYSIIEKIPQRIREMRRGLKIKFKEFKDAYKLFEYHDDIAFKNNYAPRYDLKMNYSATKKEMNSLYKKLKVSRFLKKGDEPQSVPKVEEVKEVIEEIKDNVDENKMPSKTKINEMAIILNVTPKDLTEMYKNKINSNKKENEIEEVKEDWREKYVKLGEDLNRIVRGVVQVDDLIKMFENTAGRERDVIKLQGDNVRMKEEYKTKLKEFKEVEKIMIDNNLGDKIKLLPFMDEVVKAAKKVKEPEIKEEIKDEPEISSNLVKYSFNKIKKEIAEIPKSIWWGEKNGEFIIIAKGDNDDEADKIMREKVAAKPKKYLGKQLIRMHHHFTENRSISYGDILFTFHTIIVKDKINKNLNLEAIDGKTGAIWFTKKWLGQNGFKQSYISNMLGAIYNDKIRIGVGPMMYEMIRYQHKIKKKSKSKSKPIEVPVVKEPEIKGSDKLSDVVAKGLSIDDIVKKLLEMKKS
jgi:hypothetical protein